MTASVRLVYLAFLRIGALNFLFRVDPVRVEPWPGRFRPTSNVIRPERALDSHVVCVEVVARHGANHQDDLVVLLVEHHHAAGDVRTANCRDPGRWRSRSSSSGHRQETSSEHREVRKVDAAERDLQLHRDTRDARVRRLDERFAKAKVRGIVSGLSFLYRNSCRSVAATVTAAAGVEPVKSPKVMSPRGTFVQAINASLCERRYVGA